MFSTFLTTTLLCFLASCKSEAKNNRANIRQFLCKSILDFEKCTISYFWIIFYIVVSLFQGAANSVFQDKNYKIFGEGLPPDSYKNLAPLALGHICALGANWISSALLPAQYLSQLDRSANAVNIVRVDL